MSSSADRSKGRPRSYRSTRQTAVAIAAFLSLGVFAGGEYVSMRTRVSAVVVTRAVPATPSDAEIYTGSILYMPYDGRMCRQILFDNRTGRSSDNGYVDCEQAAYRSASDEPSGVQAISAGFRR
jgi:hypothetical protein